MRWLHVHLGLYGKWWWQHDPAAAGEGPPTPGTAASPDAAGSDGLEDEGDVEVTTWQPSEPRPTARVHLENVDGPGWVAELTGPTRCEVVTTAEKLAVEARLGPDPLRPDHQERGAKILSDAIRRRRRAVGELLMDQSIVAGVGNIYRAEVLFRARLNPYTLGVDVSARKSHAMWRDLVALMADGVGTGSIVTTDPIDRPYGEEIGELAPAAERASEWEADQRFYVYKRTGRPCHRCGTAISQAEMVGRQLYWCPRCQRR